MSHPSFLLLLSLSLFATSLSLPSPALPIPDRFIKPIRQNSSPQEYIELAPPLATDRLIPSCSLQAFNHTFGDTMGRPPTSVSYSPPSDCLPPWSRVVLELHVSSHGDQYDRIAAVWLAGAEILRTSTAEPNAGGVFWKVRNDVTRYAFLLQQSNLALMVMLENLITDDLIGVYDVTLTLRYYKSNHVGVPPQHRKLSRKSGLLEENLAVDFANKESQLGLELESEKFLGSPQIKKSNSDSLDLYKTPADLIIPISSGGDEGFWFRIESESGVESKGIQIPPNTCKAVLEIYVSFHGNDEFWYSNPPDSYIRMNNLTTGRAHGAYREVLVTIDGSFLGSVIPIPVIFTGGINPLFWEPVVAIGAFNLPTYDFDLTPYLGFLLDGKVHFIGLGVADSIPFWLVDANLHLWLDHRSLAVEAKTVYSNAPKLSIKRSSQFELLDGSFKIKAKRKSRFLGWVKSSEGNFTTHVLNQFKYKNLIRFEKDGTYKSVKQIVKTMSEVRVESQTGSLISRTMVKRKYPLRLITSTLPGSETDAYLMVTNVSHLLREKFISGDLSSSLHNSQDSRGWMEVKDNNVLSGSATTDQSLSSEGF